MIQEAGVILIHPNGAQDNTNKYRIGTSLGLVFVAYSYNHILSTVEFIKCTGIGITIGVLIAVLFIRYDLIRIKYVKGLGCLTFAISSLGWKRLHAFSIPLEAVIALSLFIFFLILTFRYTGSELEGKFEKQELVQ